MPNMRAQNPMSEYLLKLQLIINNTEFKNKAEADKYETLDSKLTGEAYVRAVRKTDTFESYQYNSKRVYMLLINNGYTDQGAKYAMDNQRIIRQDLKQILLEEARNEFMLSFVEENKYYVTLTGKPFQGNDSIAPDEEVLIPDGFYEIYQKDNVISRNQPVHTLPYKYQELLMNSDYYKQLLNDHPDADYLRYIGSNSIPIEVSRKARDGDIMRINTDKLSTYHEVYGNVSVSPDIVHAYTNIYRETRDYVFGTLRGDFSEIYANYDSFIRFLTIYMSIGNALNEFMHKSSKLIYMNNVTANNMFMLYGLPSVIMEGASMITFLKKLRLLLMDKGTNIVYRVKDLIGYQYTDIYTLVMVKQQVFENGIPIYVKDDDGNRVPKQEIVFRRLGTSGDNTSYFSFRDSDLTYTLDEITSGDPRWWNTKEVDQMLTEMNYTLSNSKYIQLSTHLSMSDIWWQCVILLRGILDRRQETQFVKLNVNYNVDGASEMTAFDAVLTLVILMNHQMGFKGNMYLANGSYDGRAVCLDLLFNGLNDDGSPKDLVLGLPYKITSFNFNIRENNADFYNTIPELDYIEPETFLPMLNSVLDRENSNIGEVLMTDVKLIYKYLETKLRTSTTIREFRQVTDVFSNLFLVDPIREDWYSDITADVDIALMNAYQISTNELSALKSFFNLNEIDFYVNYNDEEFGISLYDVLNESVTTITINEIMPFNNDDFVDAFITAMDSYRSTALETSSISDTIKVYYKDIIISKVEFDVGNTTDGGPKTFESLLFRENPSLYGYINKIKNTPEAIVLLMRAIIKALETYTNSDLGALEFKALGVENYFYILKEVISYFKSYMVEYTKEEFVYIFDGLFDNGGNSNMLRLYDEINDIKIIMVPKDSATLYDVSTAKVNAFMPDNNTELMNDDAIFRLCTAYKNIVNTGYDIWYDNGKKITHESFDIADDTNVIADIVSDDNGIKIIININNLDVIPPNYVGNGK